MPNHQRTARRQRKVGSAPRLRSDRTNAGQSTDGAEAGEDEDGGEQQATHRRSLPWNFLWFLTRNGRLRAGQSVYFRIGSE